MRDRKKLTSMHRRGVSFWRAETEYTLGLINVRQVHILGCSTSYEPHKSLYHAQAYDALWHESK